MKIKSIFFINKFDQIRNKDGKKIKPNSLISSSELSSLNNEDINLLKGLNVTDIIDFRSNCEIKHKPDVEIKGVNYYPLHLLTDEDATVVTKENRIHILKEKMKYPGGVKACVCSYYDKLVTSSLGIEGYKKAFEIVKNSKGTVIYHCTQGKDRTGLFTSMLLYILGFDRKSIYKTYKKYNRKTFFKHLGYVLGVMFRYCSIRKAKALSHVLVSRNIYIDHTVAVILRNYGSIDAYLEKALNIRKEDKELLRNKYLIND